MRFRRALAIAGCAAFVTVSTTACDWEFTTGENCNAVVQVMERANVMVAPSRGAATTRTNNRPASRPAVNTNRTTRPARHYDSADDCDD